MMYIYTVASIKYMNLLMNFSSAEAYDNLKSPCIFVYVNLL